MLSGPVGPTLARLAVPGIAASLTQSSLTVVEGIYLGMLGTVELAGVALVFPIYMLINMLSAGAVGGAVAGATARAMGAEDHGRAETILRLSIVIGLTGGGLMAVIVIGFGATIFTLLGGTGQVHDVAMTYSGPLFVGAVFMWLFNMMCSVLRGTGDTLRPAIGFTLIAICHAVLAAILA